MPGPNLQLKPVRSTLWAEVSRLAFVIGLEQRILMLIVSYALAIALFSLVVPLTVQELVNSFAISIQPVMIVTLALIILIGLLFIGFFRVFQTSATEILFQRLYTRIAIAMTEHLPRVREDVFVPSYANYFGEAELLPRAVVVVLVDLINVVISGATGMLILVVYHPNFLVYNAFLIGGFGLVQFMSARGGVQATQTVSQLHYDLMTWMQDIAQNRLHFKATQSAPLLLSKTDRLLDSYLSARRARSGVLTWRQYVSTVIWEAVCHSSMIGMGGWLLSVGQITLGQFVAAEVIVGTLLLNLDTVTRRMYAVTYILTSFDELTRVFSLPKDDVTEEASLARLADPAIHGLRVTCKNAAFAYPNSPPVIEGFNLEVVPGEKVAVISSTSTGKSTLALLLAGLSRPTAGVIRFNDVDLREMTMEEINAARALVLDSHLTLFGGTLEENISLGRPSVKFEDLRWALRFTGLEDDADRWSRGLETQALAGGKLFTKSQILRILVARAIVTRPQLLIFDGTLHNMEPDLRQILLRRLCSKEEAWSVIFVTNDPSIGEYVDRRVMLG
ncbi:MAG: ABC transporter ATP-binding protein [Nitrospira sp.]|nr:ABC transporter ATP-binding protein [Nitrospira sp.]MBP6606355.1 ABC transporter ATP-binding protein [Nitrospira sp.]HQY57263.1 ABC transporter ATP-binding protein [Nitrospira sp.]HRA96907.1 ABC transporter ATP-binding protein [Nitrospira sp.]